jgi:hypothetical protein
MNCTSTDKYLGIYDTLLKYYFKMFKIIKTFKVLDMCVLIQMSQCNVVFFFKSSVFLMVREY